MTVPGPDDIVRVTVVVCADQFATDSDYTRRFWTSQTGPTATTLLQLLAGEGTRAWRYGDLAARLGVAHKAHNLANNPLARALDRLTKFRLIERPATDRILVRSHLPRLETRFVARMSDELRREHAAYVAAWDATSALVETDR